VEVKAILRIAYSNKKTGTDDFFACFDVRSFGTIPLRNAILEDI
jgi:hypothetical protein